MKNLVKVYKIPIIVISVLIVIVIVLLIFFTVVASNNEVVTNPITFQEKYVSSENKINNLVTTNSNREGLRSELGQYADKVKQDYNMTVDDRDSFMTVTRKIDNEYLSSKMHVLSFYGKVKQQFDLDVAANYFTPEVKTTIDTLFVEYSAMFKEGKYQEAYNRLDDISKKLSVRVTEEGIQVEEPAPAQPAPDQAQQQAANAGGEQPVTTSNETGKGYHPEAKAGTTVVDPNNGNTGVVADNGIEVYRLPNETTYSYITKEEFVAMLVRSGTRESLARVWADQMANADGLITIGVDDDGTYE